MTIFVTADLHFNHAGILNFTRRPFKDVASMNQGLIDRWNAVVGPTDEVYVVGDFGFSNKRDPLEDIFAELKGRKHLIIGNHDEQNRTVLALGWESQQHYLKLRWEGKRAILCHYPLETWDGAHRGYIHLHGHSHGTLKRTIPHRFDVGVDADPAFKGWPLSIWSWFQVAADQGEYEPQDHHEARP